MKRPLEALFVLGLLAVAAFAQDGSDPRPSLETKYACKAAPGATCVYKPVVDLTGVYTITCSDAGADPAPEVVVEDLGPVTKCDVNRQVGLRIGGWGGQKT